MPAGHRISDGSFVAEGKETYQQSLRNVAPTGQLITLLLPQVLGLPLIRRIMEWFLSSLDSSGREILEFFTAEAKFLQHFR